MGEAVGQPLDSDISPQERADIALWELQLGSAVELRDLFEEDPLVFEIAKHAGQSALSSELSDAREFQNQQETISRSLMEATKNAQKGDLAAREMIRQNVVTDHVERRYKSKTTLNVRVTVGEDGSWSQNGQSYDEVHENAEAYITHPILKPRTVIENTNKRMIIKAFKEGLLKDNIIVIESRVTDGISADTADRVGWFGNSMSKALQLIYEDDETGDIIIESNFLAGAEERNGERFDREATEYAHASVLQLDSSGLSAEEMLAQPKLVPKAKLPAVYSSDGALVMRAGLLVDGYDGNSGRWFGERHQGEKDYQAHLDQCQRREEQSKSEVEQVTQQLIDEADTFKVPTDATKRLHDLNEAKLKKAIIVDHTIDSAVLGPAAQPHVERARLYYQAGNEAALRQEQTLVNKLGHSSSCPDGIKDALLNGELGEEDDPKTPEDCDFISKECPKCGEKNVYTRCRNGKYYGDCGCVG